MTCRILNICILLVLTSLVQSCATVRDRVNDSDFRAQNLPVRELKIIVASDGSRGREEIDRLLNECSRLLDEQVGIRFVPVEYIPIAWQERDVASMLGELKKTTDGHDFDMAIGVTRWQPAELLTRNLLGTWDGCIDDTFRRYVVVKHLDKRTLLHEVCHAFIFSNVHSTSGLMMPVSLQFLPFLPIKMQSLYLAPDDRVQILKNKWRDFSEIPEIELREHPLAPNLRSGGDK